MTIRVAVLIFVVSFAAITGWLVMRKPADNGIAQSAPAPAGNPKTSPPEQEKPNDEGSEALAISDEELGLRQTLRSVTIPVIDLENVSLEEALAFLNLKLRETESTPLSNLNFIIRKQPVTGDHNEGFPGPSAMKVTLRAENITMAEAIKRICQQTGHQWSIESQTLVLNPHQ